MVPLAVEAITRELTGRESPLALLDERKIPYYGVKEAVFPFNMFQEVDPVLGPEMRSTGEVLGLAFEPGEAYFKAEEAANSKLPLSGNVLMSISDKDKSEISKIAEKFIAAGFKLLATEGTFETIKNSGLDCEKVGSQRPSAIDKIINGQIQLVVNTPREKALTNTGSLLRRSAIKAGIPYITTIAGADAAIKGITAVKNHDSESLKSIQEWHALIN